MAKDTEQIVVGANGTIRVAPPDATLPDDIEEAFGSEWTDLGYTDESGATFTDSKTLETIRVWQLFYPARRSVTERDFSVSFVLRQFSAPQVELALGGGDVSETTNGWRYDPPEPEHLDERALALEWQDGAKNYRLILRRGMVTENVSTSVVRTGPTDLPITFGILGDDADGSPWYFLTDDEAFADLVPSS